MPHARYCTLLHERADLQHELQSQPPPAQRTRQILEELRQQGRVVAAELARRYAVSEDSIRRDLRELAAQGMCQRVYGGAVLPPPKERPLRERLTRDRGDKAELAPASARCCTPARSYCSMPVQPTWRSPSTCRPPQLDGDHQRATDRHGRQPA